jgi:hypothetical protein
MEKLFRPIVDHPRRAWFGAGVAILIVVTFGLPCADKYFAAADRLAAVESTREVTDEGVDRSAQYAERVVQRRREVAAHAAGAVSERRAQDLRNELVQAVRDSGCAMRRVRVADAQERDWYEGDHPLSVAVRTEKDKKTGFRLRARTLSLSAAGPITDVHALLAAIERVQGQVRPTRLSIRRVGMTDEVELELDLGLYELVQESGGGG